jgi:hypothetical protein
MDLFELWTLVRGVPPGTYLILRRLGRLSLGKPFLTKCFLEISRDQFQLVGEPLHARKALNEQEPYQTSRANE